PEGFMAAIFAARVLWGTMVEYTLHSRMRRAITCVYCDPKSKMTICSVMEIPKERLFPLSDDLTRKKVNRVFFEKELPTDPHPNPLPSDGRGSVSHAHG